MKTSLLTTLLLSGSLLLASSAHASLDLAKKNSCLACHAMDKKLVGPSFKDIANKYKGQNMQAKLEEKVKKAVPAASARCRCRLIRRCLMLMSNSW
ncbi:c-type cytochrome [Vogesella fluminis]|uniref:c-type cytochrome n=1 Tax=Vogesella fluminis TaxID=1069161 RepID=UPI00363DA613